ALLFLVLGPTRLSALTVNFCYFALLQGVLAGTVSWLSRRWSLALAALGLLLACGTLYYPSGGLFDFRLDFAAFCLYGVVVGLALRSGLFLSRRWSLAVGAATGVLLLTRHLTAPYAGVVFVGFFLFLCARWYLRRHDPRVRAAVLRRLGGLALAGAVVAV